MSLDAYGAYSFIVICREYLCQAFIQMTVARELRCIHRTFSDSFILQQYCFLENIFPLVIILCPCALPQRHKGQDAYNSLLF